MGNSALMSDVQYVLHQHQRDEILNAVAAVQRQLQGLTGKPDWQAFWVLGTNLTIIQTTLTNLPRLPGPPR
jgi:hypothetical protein